MDNLQKTDKFLKTYSPPKLSEEETDNLNILISRSEIEFVTYKRKERKKTSLQFWHLFLSGEFSHSTNQFSSISWVSTVQFSSDTIYLDIAAQVKGSVPLDTNHSSRLLPMLLMEQYTLELPMIPHTHLGLIINNFLEIGNYRSKS